MQDMADDDDEGDLIALALASLVVSKQGLLWASLASLTWMMKMVMGFLGSYTDGFPPSKIPPCGATRTVEVGAAEAVVVVAMVNEAQSNCSRDGASWNVKRAASMLPSGKQTTSELSAP